MPIAVATRHRRRFSALIQLVLFAFSASTSLLPCANAMGSSMPEHATGAHHAVLNPHASHTSHGMHDAPTNALPDSETPAHSPSPVSSSCAWVVGCTGMVQLAFESSWTVVETTPVTAVPVGVTLRAATADRDVESPPPRS